MEKMMSFEYKFPVNLVFGRGKINYIGEYAKTLGKKAMIVTGKNSTKKTGLLYGTISLLEKEGVECIVFDKVGSNPLTTTVEEGVEVVKNESCDLIIGLGGGSSLDASKGIAFSAINPGPIKDYIFGKEGNGALPIIAVTTTAGTGSEADCFAVLTIPETRDKKSLKSPYIYPKVAIVDPELMTTLPKHIIAPTGFDALCHALEAYIANNSNPITEMLALKAIEYISNYLVEVYKDVDNLDAWDKVALANTYGGMVIDRAGVTLPHGLEHPVSGLLDVVHGEGLAALIVPIMEYTYLSSPKKFIEIAKAMGEDVEGLSIEDAAAKSIDAVKKLLEKLDLTPSLSSLGVSEEHIDWLTENALKTMTYAINNHPKVPNIDEIKNIYRKCL